MKYKEPGQMSKLSFDTVQAVAILAEENHPLPDPIALMAHLSAANLIFRRWSVLLHNKKNRTNNELGGTRYEVNEVKGRKTVSISHNLCDVARGYRASWDESTLERMLKQSCYASLLPYDASGVHMPFDRSIS